MASQEKTRFVPVFAQCNDHPAWLAGIPCPDFFTNPEIFAKAQILIREYYGFDRSSAIWDAYNIEAEALGQELVYPPDGIPDINRADFLIKSRKDLDKLRPPDPHASGRMPFVHRVNKIFASATGRPAAACFCAPFSLAVNIRGYENLIDDMYDDPGFVHSLFEFLTDEVLTPYIQAMRQESGLPDLTAEGIDAWASPPMINLDMMDEFVVNYADRLRQKAGGRVLVQGNWGESKSRDVERFLNQKLKCSPRYLSVLDPDLFKIGPETVKAFAQKHDVYITAGVDAKLLQTGPVEAIVERIRNYIDLMARDGRGAIFLNQIPAQTPPEHIHAAVAACRTYGRFPMPDDFNNIAFEAPRRESFAEFLDMKGESLRNQFRI